MEWVDNVLWERWRHSSKETNGREGTVIMEISLSSRDGGSGENGEWGVGRKFREWLGWSRLRDLGEFGGAVPRGRGRTRAAGGKRESRSRRKMKR